jgi:hypothetical protein
MFFDFTTVDSQAWILASVTYDGSHPVVLISTSAGDVSSLLYYLPLPLPSLSPFFFLQLFVTKLQVRFINAYYFDPNSFYYSVDRTVGLYASS